MPIKSVGLFTAEPSEVLDLSRNSVGDFFNRHVVPLAQQFDTPEVDPAFDTGYAEKKDLTPLSGLLNRNEVASPGASASRRSLDEGLFPEQQTPRTPSSDDGLLGFSIRDTLYEGEASFFKERPEVAGMAAEDGSIVLNPYSDLNETERSSVAKNEALRLKMRRDSFTPPIEITPEQRAFFKDTEYSGDDDALKQTIFSRIHSGDPSAKATPSQRRAYQKYLQSQRARRPQGGVDQTPFLERPTGGSASGLTQFVKQFERWNSNAFDDYKQVSIGYGTKARPGETSISREEGERRLGAELQKSRQHVESFAKKHNYNFSKNQIDALTSFSYNIGSINELTANGTRTPAQISAKIPEYRKAGGKVLKGLVRRRAAEQKLFNTKS